MRNSIGLLLTALLFSFSCGSESSDSPADDDATEDEGQSGSDDDGDQGEDTATDATTSPGTSRDSGARPDSSVRPRDSGAGGSVDTGTEPASGGDGGSGTNDDDDDDDEPPTTGGPEPRIPEPSMACPAFTSGMNTIMGQSVEIVMGPKTDKKGPLLFNWHGTMGTGPQALSMTPQAVKDDIMQQGGMIVAPTTTTMTGTDVTFLLGVWYTPGDLEVADLIVACAVKEHNIDPRQIYATGCSAGGLMAGVMAFHRSSYVAAAAPNSGGVVSLPGLTDLEDPMHVPAVMTMHGPRGSDTVIVEFADTSAALDMAMAAAGGFVVNCDHGGGHCRASQELLTNSWEFMKAHPFGVDPKPYADGLPSNFPEYCTIIE